MAGQYWCITVFEKQTARREGTPKLAGDFPRCWFARRINRKMPQPSRLGRSLLIRNQPGGRSVLRQWLVAGHLMVKHFAQVSLVHGLPAMLANVEVLRFIHWQIVGPTPLMVPGLTRFATDRAKSSYSSLGIR
jgi:hypothetical protein